MIEISLGFKNFESIRKFYWKMFLKLPTLFLKPHFEKGQVSKYYFLSFIQTFASLLAKEMSYKVIYKAFYAKGLFERYISKTIL
jgi:hypothetical protein